MDFIQFIKRANLVDILFQKLDLVIFNRHTIHVDNHPDYDIFRYGGPEVVPYYFQHSWRFGDLYYSVIKAEFGRYGVFNHSSVNDILDDFGLPKVMHDEPLELAVERAANFPSRYSNVYYDHEYDNFTVKKIRVDYVNNNQKEIEYSGFFTGDSSAIEDDIILIAELNVKAINANLTEPLYRLLLADSYMHFCNQQYNQAFFYAFVSFETYINKSNKKGQLKQKILTMKNKESECYSKAVEELQRFGDLRNSIAHGRGLIQISKEIVTELYAIVIPFILYCEFNTLTYNSILRKTKNHGQLSRLRV